MCCTSASRYHIVRIIHTLIIYSSDNNHPLCLLRNCHHFLYLTSESSKTFLSCRTIVIRTTQAAFHLHDAVLCYCYQRNVTITSYYVNHQNYFHRVMVWIMVGAASDVLRICSSRWMTKCVFLSRQSLIRSILESSLRLHQRGALREGVRGLLVGLPSVPDVAVQAVLRSQRAITHRWRLIHCYLHNCFISRYLPIPVRCLLLVCDTKTLFLNWAGHLMS